ncbi:MAG TPA: hypothetical protein VFM01_05020 [Nakamurella sp.]|nr:hypothetical protein [Nakamurella sp.]
MADDTDRGHLLPDEDWAEVVRQAEAIDRSRAQAPAQPDDEGGQ